MSARRYLLCESLQHAAVCDMLCCEFFRDRDGNKGSGWSGTFAKPGILSDTYAIEWDEQLRDVFGDDPQLVIEEDVDDEWQPLPEPEPVP